MQPHISSFLFVVLTMTNFSAIAQSLDKSRVALSKASQATIAPSNSPKAAVKESKSTDYKLNQKSLKDSKTFQAMGGVATGGGNKLPNYDVGNGTVVKLIENVKQPTKYAIRSVEMLFDILSYPGIQRDPNLDPTTEQQLQFIKTKLFTGKTTIYDALEQAVLKPEVTGPCYDREGNAVDASAKDAPTICLSVERLANMGQDSAQREIVALVAHEVSHMLGTTEAEATMFQEMVRTNLQRAAIDRIPDLVKGYDQGLQDALSNAGSLKQLASQGQKQMACTSAAMFQASISTLLQKNINSSNENGIIFLRPTEGRALYGVMLKSMNIMEYCMAPAVFMNIAKAYKGRSEISLQEFSKAVSGGHSNTMPAPNWTIRRIKNTAIMSVELGEIQKALQTIRERL